MAEVAGDVADYRAICALKARYCRMIDTKDWGGWRACVTDDFVMDVTEGTDLPLIEGPDAALAQICGSIETARTAHQVHMPELAINGDEASGIWAMQDRVIWQPPRPKLTGYGQYHETYRRVDGEWRIATLRLTRFILEMEAQA